MDYGKMKLGDLRHELRIRGIKTAGRKEELITRLEDFNRMQEHIGFGADDIDIGTASMPPWPDSAFRSLTTTTATESMPSLLDEHIEAYVQNCQGCNTVVRPDQGTLLKGKKLSAEKIDALSFCVNDDKIYISGCVGASMRKKTSYIVKIILAKHGDICHSACECPSGKGPNASCKHICAALFAVVSLKAGKKVQMTETCTQTLQTFHKPSRVHVGSPVRAEKLTIPDEQDEEEDEDPRPAKYRSENFRKWYPEMVKMATVAYTYYSGMDVTMRYTIGRANLQVAALDHDYLSKPFLQE